jgi:hypothetical protein
MSSRRKAPPSSDESFDDLSDNAEYETGRALRGRPVTVQAAMAKLHRQHIRMTIASIAVLLLVLLQIYAELTTHWMTFPLITRCVFWRMFLFPVVALFAAWYARHLFHDNSRANLDVGKWIMFFWAVLQTAYGIYLAAIEAFWWCPSHMFDYCTDTVTTTLTMSYWIFIVANWVMIPVAIWLYLIVRSVAKYNAVLYGVFSKMSNEDLAVELRKSVLGDGHIIHGIGTRFNSDRY